MQACLFGKKRYDRSRFWVFKALLVGVGFLAKTPSIRAQCVIFSLFRAPRLLPTVGRSVGGRARLLFWRRHMTFITPNILPLLSRASAGTGHAPGYKTLALAPFLRSIAVHFGRRCAHNSHVTSLITLRLRAPTSALPSRERRMSAIFGHERRMSATTGHCHLLPAPPAPQQEQLTHMPT